MTTFYIATPPRELASICISDGSRHCFTHHTFWTKEIPFKQKTNDAILSALRCNSVLSQDVIHKDTEWMVIGVELSMEEIGQHFLNGNLRWVKNGIRMSADLMKKSADVVGACAVILL